MSCITESIVEDAALAWLEALGYAVLHGPDIAAGEPGAERSDPNYRDVLLERRLRQALARLNPDLLESLCTADSIAGTQLRTFGINPQASNTR